MMKIDVSNSALENICDQLKSPHQAGKQSELRSAHLDIIRDGWGMRHDVQDVLWETDCRADRLAHGDSFDCLLAPYQLNWISRYRRPPASGKEAWGGQAMRTEDIAVWIMEIERLGFSVDAIHLVSALRPKILRQSHVTNSELAIMWYGRERHKFEPIILHSGKTPNRLETVITQSEYKATILYSDDTPVTLRVDPPKGRKGLPLKYWLPVQMRSWIND